MFIFGELGGISFLKKKEKKKRKEGKKDPKHKTYLSARKINIFAGSPWPSCQLQFTQCCRRSRVSRARMAVICDASGGSAVSVAFRYEWPFRSCFQASSGHSRLLPLFSATELRETDRSRQPLSPSLLLTGRLVNLKCQPPIPSLDGIRRSRIEASS